ncbi:hypothetical protein HZF07_10055 [Nocardioides sp. CGMCC 1.13656]|nr:MULTISPECIES: glycosyl hydrolase [unclassified Nocardioides]MBA2954060.1 hypothetical protein [Nocardioides sp. CGMCC 1.13656]
MAVGGLTWAPQQAATGAPVAAPDSGSDVPAVTTATFADPPQATRPMYRWWLPMADVRTDALADQVQDVKNVGGGGVELQPFGADVTPTTPKYGVLNYKLNQEYLAEKGWGTPAWSDVQRSALQLGNRNGLQVDAINAAGWGPSIPTLSDINDPAVARKLISVQTQVPAGGTFSGALPESGRTDTADPYATDAGRPNNVLTARTTLCFPAAAGSRNLAVASTASMGPGARLTVGTGANAEEVVVTRVGTQSLCAETVAPAAAGATNVKVNNLGRGWKVGQQLTIGEQTVTITDVLPSSNAHAAPATTLVAAAAAGDSTVKLAAVAPAGNFNSGQFMFNVGDTISVDGELRTITGPTSEVGIFNGTAGVNGTGVQLSAPLTSAHASGSPARNIGRGVTFAPALSAAAPIGTPVTRRGSGVQIASPLSQDRAATTEVVNVARRDVVSVLVAQCASANCPATGGTRTLDPSSIRDVTDRVGLDGTLDYTFGVGNGNPWWVIGYYSTSAAAAYYNASMVGPSYDPDHLSAAGVRAITDYWENNILNDPQTRQSLAAQKAAGRPAAFFEDSLELAYGQTWTADFAKRFRQLNGYDISTALPAIANATVSGTQAGFFDLPSGARIRQDYLDTWNDLYTQRYLKPMRTWAHENDMVLRFQSYANPRPGGIDVPYSNTFTDIPETESLNMGRDPEKHKLIAVGAHLNGTTAVTCECAALGSGGWSTTANGQNVANLPAAFEALSGGATRMIYHGMPYLESPENSGNSSRWPGASGFGTSITENFGPVMPQWEDYRSVNEALGRYGLVLRQGKPRFDVAVLREDTNTFNAPFTTSSAMAKAGYTYEYLSSRNVNSAGSELRDGVFFPDRSGYRAIVLNSQTTFRPQASAKVLELAQQGFPVVIIGSPTAPTVSAVGFKPGDDAQVQADVNKLYDLIGDSDAKVVVVANEGGVPAALKALDVTAAAEKTETGSLLSVRRQAPDTDYYYFHNPSEAAVTETVRLHGDGVPYALDPWSGTITPIAEYDRVGDAVEVTMNVNRRNAVLLAVSDRDLAGSAPAAVHVVDTDADKIVDEDGTLLARSTTAGDVTSTLSNGTTVTSSIDAVADQRTLGDWTLNVASYGPDATGRAGISHTVKTAMGPIDVDAAADGKLPAWSALPGLADKSGVGTYTTTVTLPADWDSADGAYLSLGAATDTARITVNGTPLPALDQSDLRRIDLGDTLKAGDNTMTVRVATPLRNAVNRIRKSGAMAAGYGLVGPVVLTPYAEAVIPTSTPPTTPPPTTVPPTTVPPTTVPPTTVPPTTVPPVTPKVRVKDKVRAGATLRIRGRDFPVSKVSITLGGKKLGTAEVTDGKFDVRRRVPTSLSGKTVLRVLDRTGDVLVRTTVKVLKRKAA